MADIASLIVRVKGEGVDKTNRELGSLSGVATKAAGTVAAVSAAAIAAAGAMTAMVVSSAKSERELSNLSRTAKTTREDFAALSFVFKQYNVDAKGTADAMNDVSERLGEFAAAGTGPFQDFADVMGLTKAQAVSMAAELQKLKPEDAIQRMVKQMEDAGVQGAQMSFVMKSMSNDLEYASAAFANNGAKIKSLKKDFNELNGELVINQKQAEQLAMVATDYEMLTSALGGASSVISASLAPTMSDFFNSIISVVPNATNTIVDFINTFNKAQDIQSISQIDRQMKDLADTIENGVAKGYDKMSRNMQENPLDFVRVGKYQDAVARLAELEVQRTKLLDEQKSRELELAKVRSGGAIGSGIGKEAAKVATKDTTDSQAQAKQAAAYLEQLRQANLSEAQLIETSQRDKAEKLAEFYTQGLIDAKAYEDGLTEIMTTAVLARADMQTTMLDEQSRIADESRKQQIADAAAAEAAMLSSSAAAAASLGDITSALQSAGKEQSAAYKVLFAAQKAAAIPSMITATEEGATKALSLGPIAGPIAAGAIKALGYASIGVVAGQAITGAREQGGYMTGGSAYQMAERGKAEVIVPAGNSRAKTISQMNDMMGGNSGSTSVVIVNQTTGRIDSAESDRDDEGRIRIIIREEVSSGLLNQDSQIAKARRSTRGQAGY